MKKKARLRTWVVFTLFLLFLVGSIYYSYKIVLWKLHVDDNDKIQKKINDSIKITEPKDSNEEIIYDIDFNILKKRNPDTIAYIKVNNTNINYVVVKGQDNNYYLKHNYDKKWNVAGWIFGDYRNKYDGFDKNLIIYGHNMKDGSMFDSLKKTITKEWYENEDNHIVTLVTEDNTYYYRVFSTYSILAEDYYIKTSFKNDKEYNTFLNTLKKRSVYKYNIDLTSEDRILTLSSCIGDGKRRVVLHAKLEEYIVNQ